MMIQDLLQFVVGGGAFGLVLKFLTLEVEHRKTVKRHNLDLLQYLNELIKMERTPETLFFLEQAAFERFGAPIDNHIFLALLKTDQPSLLLRLYIKGQSYLSFPPHSQRAAIINKTFVWIPSTIIFKFLYYVGIIGVYLITFNIIIQIQGRGVNLGYSTEITVLIGSVFAAIIGFRQVLALHFAQSFIELFNKK